MAICLKSENDVTSFPIFLKMGKFDRQIIQVTGFNLENI